VLHSLDFDIYRSFSEITQVSYACESIYLFHNSDKGFKADGFFSRNSNSQKFMHVSKLPGKSRFTRDRFAQNNSQ